MAATKGREIYDVGRAVINELRSSPAEAAPRLVVGALAFLAAAGGVDGNGGVPDMDLLAGITFHQSIFTHSILAGAVVETLLGAPASLGELVYDKLSAEHDPTWDSIAKHKDAYVAAAGTGASLGIAYHLASDATIQIQEGTYHGMPGPMHGRANSATEAIEAAKREGDRVILECAHCSSRAPGCIRRMVGAPKCNNDFWAD